MAKRKSSVKKGKSTPAQRVKFSGRGKKSLRAKISQSKKKVKSKSAQKRKSAPASVKKVGSKFAYYLNPDFQYLEELRSLLLKFSETEFDLLSRRVNQIGRIKLAVVGGIFLEHKQEKEPILADLFLVGDDVDSRKLRNFIKGIEADLGTEIKFVLMERDEFRYRFKMFDRFIRVLFEGPHKVLFDRIGVNQLLV
ncbi:MAG: hypothetical protein COV31_02825 [Candidatus Yanofskybacteria bacterium CG10_big_fil_rev_8_21_14_0_10_46_23]|uniref:Polymerase beta nucleotidyltransferase domain-containing protein n=1 Tax=Candidatus Yanofskybacteria bacterium CG10_big_fil_rev_8_21_14_0_10_46_23 TaxID=1975098 RepID=A0A2H0R3P3_9BACT|nr:MAG: hypothetical protein COV31_02825 [Candidatus Yanofskybacteria bacterium CG10_big_fil_rev_8_21_14_0_10_46_23]